MSLLTVYALVTLFPFYVLFVRTFVGTAEATDLHLSPPPVQEIDLDAELGNLAVFYDLDIRQVKRDLDIPAGDYVSPRTKLRTIAQTYDIPPARIRAYLAPFSRYSGWIALFSAGKVWRPLVRTVVITVLSLIGINMLSVGTAYGLAGLRRRDQTVIYHLYLLHMVIPSMLIILPQFIMVQWLLSLIPGYQRAGFARYTTQILMLVLINVKGGALSTMLFTSYIGSIPREFEEAAMLDGASRLQYIQHVLLPLMKVPIASLTVIQLPQYWNQFLKPYVYLDPKNASLLPLVQAYAAQYTTNFQIVYTAIFVSIAPMVILFLVFRRTFIRGVLVKSIYRL
jgi:ABC-type glycerol-3-phosphate transport system permease component